MSFRTIEPPGKDYRVTEIGVSLYIKWVKPGLNNVDGDLRGASLIQSEMKSQSFTVKTRTNCHFYRMC